MCYKCVGNLFGKVTATLKTYPWIYNRQWIVLYSTFHQRVNLSPVADIFLQLREPSTRNGNSLLLKKPEGCCNLSPKLLWNQIFSHLSCPKRIFDSRRVTHLGIRKEQVPILCSRNAHQLHFDNLYLRHFAWYPVIVRQLNPENRAISYTFGHKSNFLHGGRYWPN